MSLNQVLEEIEEKGITGVRFEQTDLNGVARSKLIPSRHFKDKATGGVNFYLGHIGMDVQAGVIPGTGFAEEVGYCDAVMFPDYSSFKELPWAEKTARILVEPTYKGEYVAAHPRVAARRQLEKLKDLGYSLFSAHEHEFYVVDKVTKKPINNDINIRSTLRMFPLRRFVKQVMEDMPVAGVDIEQVESEYGPGQVEISYKPAFGIRSADNAFTFKTGIKEIALLHGFQASFMSKPFLNQSGSCTHFCHSLYQADEKTPVFYDANSPIGLSEVGQNWAAGILAHAPAIEVLMAPTVNCLKRVGGNFCPENATWGMDNRTTMLRIKVNGDKGTYMENRAGAAGANCYLVLAATVAAGMDGIINKYRLPAETTGCANNPEDVPPKTADLPNNMEAALEALVNDEVIRNAFGEDFIKCFSAVKMHEAKLEKQALAKGQKNWDFDFYFEYL
ncbi:lengsin-like [Lytechinus variegatus]|uniref:lengsin-like n=1 Tax=Lytechinus variegatus TaxID=7654 RepID=UPI001BB1D5DB|nr:lengsin-like [Lytechinus variegatus]